MKFITKITVAAAMLAAVSGIASAQGKLSDNPEYYKLGKVTLTEISPAQLAKIRSKGTTFAAQTDTTDPYANYNGGASAASGAATDPSADAGYDSNSGYGGTGYGSDYGGYGNYDTYGQNDMLSKASRLVNLGQQVIQIIDRNRPVVRVDTNYATAVPKEVTHWTDMAGWRMGSSKLYEFTGYNALHMQVIHVVYRIHYAFGGSYNGVGKYLTGVSVEPVQIKVGYGYNFNSSCSVPPEWIINVSNDPAKPVAAMKLKIQWHYQSKFKSEDGSDSFAVFGDGGLRKVDGFSTVKK